MRSGTRTHCSWLLWPERHNATIATKRHKITSSRKFFFLALLFENNLTQTCLFYFRFSEELFWSFHFFLVFLIPAEQQLSSDQNCFVYVYQYWLAYWHAIIVSKILQIILVVSSILTRCYSCAPNTSAGTVELFLSIFLLAQWFFGTERLLCSQ